VVASLPLFDLAEGIFGQLYVRRTRLAWRRHRARHWSPSCSPPAP
jgi:hypothetical protein